MHEAVGVIHLHSTFSDGTADIGEIMTAASRNHLDFVVLTDHDTLRALEFGYEAYHDGIMLLCGYEITPEKDHYLVLGTDKLIKSDGGPQAFVPAVRYAGGLGFIAHPDHVGVPRFGVGRYDWTNWEVDGFTGVGVWDLMTDWQERVTGIWQGIKGVLNPLGHIRGPRAVTLKRWDEMNLKRRVVGIGEIDNHGKHHGFLFIRLTIFPYRFAMGTVHNHLLLEKPLSGNFKRDKRALLDVLRLGRLYISMEAFGSAKGFRFWGELSYGKSLSMGDRVEFSEGVAFRVESPREAKIRLLCSGVVVKEAVGNRLEYEAGSPGVYRAEVYLPSESGKNHSLPWVFSNPIVLMESQG